MQVQVFDLPRSVTEMQVHHKTVIVIDVLRATSSITTAIESGAKQVIPALDPGEAIALYGKLGRGDSLLAGERGGLKLPDFDLGNSPLEFSPQKVRDKTVIFSTTNGTNAILAARNAAELFIGCMRNRTAAAKAALATGNDILLLCAGTEGMFSADDICCAGAIVDAISQLASEPVGYTDLARVSRLIYTQWRDGQADLSQTYHYARLSKLGFQEDLAYCFQTDVTDAVPRYANGVVVAK